MKDPLQNILSWKDCITDVVLEHSLTGIQVTAVLLRLRTMALRKSNDVRVLESFHTTMYGIRHCFQLARQDFRWHKQVEEVLAFGFVA